MTIRITQTGTTVTIKPMVFLGGDKFGQYRTATAGAKYDPTTKTQVTVLTKLVPIITRLQSAGFDLDVAPDVRAAVQALTAQTRLDLDATKSRASAKDAELAARGKALFPFQKTGMAWLTSRHGALLADEMGLGKTVQALMALPDMAPVLVVCPAVAKGVWKREARAWRPEYRVTVLSGKGSFRWPRAGEIVVTNYDILQPSEIQTSTGVKSRAQMGLAPIVEGATEAAPLPGTVLVGDEIHKAKNPTAQRTKRFRTLALAVQKVGGRLWGLTGTPLENRPPELWAVLSSLGLTSDAFGTWATFVELLGGHKGRYGYEWDRGVPNPVKVGDALKRVMLRRLRTEVMPELPVKTWTVVDVDLTRACTKVCDETWEVVQDTMASAKKMDLGTMASARAALATAKIPTMIELVEEFEENDEPVVVFSAHRAPIDALRDRDAGKGQWAFITGDTPNDERTSIEDRFQRGELRGIGATIRAAGVAITLTRSHNALFVDRDWNPSSNEQAEDRLARIGQNQGVIITDLVGNHALDRHVWELLGKKKILIEDTVEQGRRLEPEVTVADIVFTDMVNDLVAPSKWTARTPRETWAANALRKLAAHDPDMASEQNGVGFNKLDGRVGHDLARRLDGGFTQKQWDFAVKLCTKYSRQIGAAPSLSEPKK